MGRDYVKQDKFPPEIYKLAKETIEKNQGHEVTDKEINSVLDFMRTLAEISLDQYEREEKWNDKLAKYSKGYEFTEPGYTCWLCGTGSTREKFWYDKHGLKCMLCQKAIDDKVIPGSVVRDKDSYYTEYDLESNFKLKGKVLKEWMTAGLIHGRMIYGLNGKRKHMLLFLMQDNKGFLPPKKLFKIGGMETEIIDGKEWQVSRPWYYYVDPFVYLKKYGIMQYMQRSTPEISISETAQQGITTEQEDLQKPQMSYCANCALPAGVFGHASVKKRKAKRK